MKSSSTSRHIGILEVIMKIIPAHYRYALFLKIFIIYSTFVFGTTDPLHSGLEEQLLPLV